MDELLAALADPARWRLVRLLAERPRPVGVLARLAEARQPQTTKHLQNLERAGVVVSQRTGQRRIYALRPGPLRDLAAVLNGLADAADQAGETYDRYGLSVQAERLAAREAGWADGRSFRFHRSLAASPELVWRHLTEAELLARWWTPDELRVSELVFEAWPGGRIVHEYRDAEDADGSDPVAGRAEGVVVEAQPGERLSYRLSPRLPGGGVAFTAHLDLDLRPGGAGSGAGTELEVRFRVADSTVDSADFIAGIELGFGQSLDKLAATLQALQTNQADQALQVNQADQVNQAGQAEHTDDTTTGSTT
ncbi:metalloregulator ArsR/SmtB family transcription factor [Nonomuraea sp. NPDC023979]|uniref:metalloregulator ArsR/SmtB family transcription factor n=1 Tax=Nonomuraea sp. NPDC023979 TaxID=3154796 RepID=UPI0033E3E1B6